MNTDDMIALLQELLYARGPCGQEDEVRAICERELRQSADEVWTDEAGNLVGHVRARDGGATEGAAAAAVRVMAHMDEIAMIVKRIDSNGALRVTNLGGLRPGYIGQGPVDILADSEILPGVLSIGPVHSSPETSHVEETKTKAIGWPHVHVFTNRTAEELAENGVHPGTKVAVARERRKLFDMGACVGGYFMDDRAAVAASLVAAALLKAEEERAHHDTYFVMTTEEELGGRGAAYASRTLPGETTIAVEIGPVAEEYRTEFRDDPIVAYGDSHGMYTRSLVDALTARARDLGMDPQKAVWTTFGSDASISKSLGLSARSALVCIPTQNTHGFEIVLREGIMKCARLLASFLRTHQ